MANMSHCRFENTTQDMRDCFDNMYDFDTAGASPYEAKAYRRFLKMVVDNAEECEELLEQIEELSDASGHEEVPA